MPVIQINMVQGVFTRRMKAQLIRKITDAFVEVTGTEKARPLVRVLYYELPPHDWGTAGTPITDPFLRKVFPTHRKRRKR